MGRSVLIFLRLSMIAGAFALLIFCVRAASAQQVSDGSTGEAQPQQAQSYGFVPVQNSAPDTQPYGIKPIPGYTPPQAPATEPPQQLRGSFEDCAGSFPKGSRRTHTVMFHCARPRLRHWHSNRNCAAAPRPTTITMRFMTNPRPNDPRAMTRIPARRAPRCRLSAGAGRQDPRHRVRRKRSFRRISGRRLGHGAAAPDRHVARRPAIPRRTWSKGSPARWPMAISNIRGSMSRSPPIGPSTSSARSIGRANIPISIT